MSTRVGAPVAAPRRVRVGPFEVDDLSRQQVVERVVGLAEHAGRDRPVVVYALHVGGLNHRRDVGFVDAMNRADVVCADGGSVVGIARCAGATSLERAPTTDVGWDVLRELARRLGRAPRLALIGGPPHLAERAGAVLAAGGAGAVVWTCHGYHPDEAWERLLPDLAKARPDVCVVGLGAPREMLWVANHRHELPPGLVLTCGGWFGHLVGEETRAPRLLRRSGLEWIARLVQDPLRLAPRYARGAWSTAVLLVRARAWRAGRRHRP